MMIIVNFGNKKGFKIGKKNAFSGLKNWGSRRTISQTEDVDYEDFSDFDTFVDQLLGRRREVRTVDPKAAQMTAADPYNSPRTKAVYKPTPRETKRDIEARLTLPLEKAYTGGKERIRLEDGRSLEVDLPPGMVKGQQIRLKNQGVNGGDLFLKINITPHPFFRVEKSEIYCQIPVTPTEAILGGEIDIPTLDGLVKMRLPLGVISGQRLRLANKGYLNPQGERGDQLIEIQVVLPKTITPQERELYEQLRQIETFKPRQNLRF